MSTTDTESAPASRRERKAWSPEASLEAAAVLRLLMVRPWLYAGRDDEAIAAVRRNVNAVRDAFLRLGWVLVIAPGLVRLRKSPPHRLAAFGSTAPVPLTCQWFFLLLAAAESMGSRTGLGQLVTAARAAAAEASLEATGDLRERRAIVAALKLLGDRGVTEELDGTLETFIADPDAPVLLAIHHDRLQHVIANPGSLDPSTDPQGWLASVCREPDPARRMRRRLVDDALVHADDLDPAEADWLSRRVRGDDGGPLATAFGLHLERRSEGAAFVVPEDAYQYPWELGPLVFPSGGTRPHAAWLLCSWVLDRGSKQVSRTAAGWHRVEAVEVADTLETLAASQGSGRGSWTAELAADPRGRLCDEVADLLEGLDLLRRIGSLWYFSPAISRWKANFAAPPRSPAITPTATLSAHTQGVLGLENGGSDDPDVG